MVNENRQEIGAREITCLTEVDGESALATADWKVERRRT